MGRGNNHYDGCTCGWCVNDSYRGGGGWGGGGGGGGPLSGGRLADFTKDYRVRLVIPRKCWHCGQPIFIYANEYGSIVLFDELGWPWPKHQCQGHGWSSYGISYQTIAPENSVGTYNTIAALLRGANLPAYEPARGIYRGTIAQVGHVPQEGMYTYNLNVGSKLIRGLRHSEIIPDLSLVTIYLANRRRAKDISFYRWMGNSVEMHLNQKKFDVDELAIESSIQQVEESIRELQLALGSKDIRERLGRSFDSVKQELDERLEQLRQLLLKLPVSYIRVKTDLKK